MLVCPHPSLCLGARAIARRVAPSRPRYLKLGEPPSPLENRLSWLFRGRIWSAVDLNRGYVVLTSAKRLVLSIRSRSIVEQSTVVLVFVS